jgi:chemotaxis protein MotA
VDKATLGGLVLAIGGILLGLMLEGGNIGQVLQPTAALIVIGGTLGAILIQYPLPVASSAFRRLAQVFVEPAQDAQSTIELPLKYANQARRDGIISLDKELANIREPFLRRALMLAVDGTDSQELRQIKPFHLADPGIKFAQRNASSGVACGSGKQQSAAGRGVRARKVL